MAGKRDEPEVIVSNLRQVEVLQGQGMTIADGFVRSEPPSKPTIAGASNMAA